MGEEGKWDGDMGSFEELMDRMAAAGKPAAKPARPRAPTFKGCMEGALRLARTALSNRAGRDEERDAGRDAWELLRKAEGLAGSKGFRAAAKRAGVGEEAAGRLEAALSKESTLLALSVLSGMALREAAGGRDAAVSFIAWISSPEAVAAAGGGTFSDLDIDPCRIPGEYGPLVILAEELLMPGERTMALARMAAYALSGRAAADAKGWPGMGADEYAWREAMIWAAVNEDGVGELAAFEKMASGFLSTGAGGCVVAPGRDGRPTWAVFPTGDPWMRGIGDRLFEAMEAPSIPGCPDVRIAILAPMAGVAGYAGLGVPLVPFLREVLSPGVFRSAEAAASVLPIIAGAPANLWDGAPDGADAITMIATRAAAMAEGFFALGRRADHVPRAIVGGRVDGAAPDGLLALSMIEIADRVLLHALTREADAGLIAAVRRLGNATLDLLLLISFARDKGGREDMARVRDAKDLVAFSENSRAESLARQNAWRLEKLERKKRKEGKD